MTDDERDGPAVPAPANSSDQVIGAKQAVVDAQKAPDDGHHAQCTVLHLLAVLLAVTPVQTHLRERSGVLQRAERRAEGGKVTIAVLLEVCARRENVRTLADLDAHGLGENAEEQSWDHVIAAGSLDRTVP